MQSPEEEIRNTAMDQLEKPQTEGPDVEAQPTEPQGIVAGVPGVQMFLINGQ